MNRFLKIINEQYLRNKTSKWYLYIEIEMVGQLLYSIVIECVWIGEGI